MRLAIAAAWIGVGLVALPHGARAAVDQEFTGPGTDATVSMDDVFDRAQTFTVGAGGTLTAIEIPIAKGGATLPDDALVLDVRGTDGAGVPLEDDGAVLATATVLASQLTEVLDPNAFFAIDLSSFAVNVNPGDELAIVARSSVPFATGRAFAWLAKLVENDGYAGGDAWMRASTWSLQNDGGVDLLFRTVVEAPESTAAQAAIAGVITLASVAARRRLTASRFVRS
jgi:hypothetical protein